MDHLKRIERNFDDRPGSHQRMIDAAIDVFARCPADAVTQEMIAREAGVSPSLLTKNFKTKTNLCRAVLREALTPYENSLARMRETTKNEGGISKSSAASLLRSFITDSMDGLYGETTHHHRYEKIILFEMFYPSELEFEFYDRYFRNQYLFLRDILTPLMKPTEPEEVIFQAVAIMGQILSFQIERHALVRFAGMAGFTQEEVVGLKKVVVTNVARMLDCPELEESFPDLPIRSTVRLEEISHDETSPSDSVTPDLSIDSVRRIVEAAIRLFAVQPFEVVSLAAIAREAKVKVPLIMYHFKSKANLYGITLESVMRAFHTRSASLRDDDPGENRPGNIAARKLCDLIDLLMDGLYRPDETGFCPEKLLLHENAFPGEYYDKYYRSFFQGRYENAVRIFGAVSGHGNRALSCLQAVSTFGMLIAFRLQQNAIRRFTNLDVSESTVFSKLKTLVKRNALAILDFPPEEAEKHIPLTINAKPGRRLGVLNQTTPLRCAEPETQERIVIAAIKVFSKIPFEMTTIDMIAKEAGVRHPLVLYYFKTKKNLYKKVLGRAVDGHVSNLQSCFDDVEDKKFFTPEEAERILARVIRVMLDGLYRLPDEGYCYVKIILLEVYFPSEFYQDVYDRYLKRYYDMMLRLALAINDRLDRKTALFQCTQILGLIVSYDVEREILDRESGFSDQSDEEKERFRQRIIDNALLLLHSV